MAAAQKSPCMRRKQQLHRLFGEVHLCALVYRALVCVLVRIYAKSHFISHLPFLLVHLWSVTVYVQIMQAPHGKNIILTFTKTMQTQKKTERERDLTTEDKWRLS